MVKNILPYDKKFPEHLAEYVQQITDAIAKKQHHDQRRHLFLNFLHLGFGIDPVEVELEKKLKACQVNGYIDAFFKAAIFEFKTNLEQERPAAKIELKKYLGSQKRPEDYLALLTDGLFFEIYQYENKNLRKIGDFELKESDPLTSFRLLDQFIFSSKPVKPSSVDIIQRFGIRSSIFNTSRIFLEGMYEEVKEEPSVKIKIKEWKNLLARVYGSDFGDASLFLRHTYLTMFSRLLVAKALFPHEPRTPKDYNGLLTGEYFTRKNLPNLVEPDFFSWALDNDQNENFIGFLSKLEGYLSIFDLKDIQEDILKELYQELVDPESRHSLGEYYTPDWLAELTLDQVGYKEGGILDPSCGSGTFLFQTIKKKRSLGLSGRKLLEDALSSIIGIDVHPLAVMMSKANMLLGLSKEITSYNKAVYFQVYLADTLMTSTDVKKRCIAVPVTKTERFMIPIRTIERERNKQIRLDEIIDKISSYAHKVAGGINLPNAIKGMESTVLSGFSDDEKFFWNQDLELLSKLIKNKRNSIWPFILKNAFRPVYLNLDKAGYIVGNPPWLSYRYIKDEAYKNRVKQLTFSLGLLEKKDVKLFTQMDTSTVFFRYCQKELLAKDGSIAFVMPKTIILPSKQHIYFQQQGVSEILDLSGVTPLFNVRAVVLIQRPGKPKTTEIPITYFEGILPRKNTDLKGAKLLLRSSTGKHDFLENQIRSPHYYDRFLQGATLVPRCFWFVQPMSGAAKNEEVPFLETSSEAKAEGKEPWILSIQGRVEREFLFETVLSKGLLPFAILRKEAIFLPITPKYNETIILDSSELLRQGKDHAAQWMQEAEKIWDERSSNEKMSINQRINYNSLLATQRTDCSYVVLYNTSGTNLTAALMRRSKTASDDFAGFVVDHKTYYYYPNTLQEGDYLCAFLNSEIVNQQIKEYQPEGLYGPRDIHRRPFEVCPIPSFDGDDPNHSRLAELGKECREKLAGFATQMEGTLAKLRDQTRRMVAGHLYEINNIVKEIFAKQGQKPEKLLKKKKDTHPTLFDMD